MSTERLKYENHISMIEINMEFEVTRLGERGQIVIPQLFRDNLKLKKGEKFMVVEQKGTIMLRRLEPPTRDEFEELLDKTHELAKKHGVTQRDVEKAIRIVRIKQGW